MKPMNQNDFRKVTAIFYRIASNKTDYQSIQNVAKTTHVPINRVQEVRNFLIQHKFMFTIGERVNQRLTWFNNSCPTDSTIESWYGAYESSISAKSSALATKPEKHIQLKDVIEFLKENNFSGEISKSINISGSTQTTIIKL